MRVRARKGQRGLSLIEVTIMLLVLMLLTSVLAPSIWDFINDAQWVKVKEDCEALVISVSRLHRDVGARLYTLGGGNPANYPARKLDLIVTDGNRPHTNMPNSDPIFGEVDNWWATGTGNAWDSLKMGMCSDQLITNSTGGFQIYPEPSPTLGVFGLAFGQGWRGAYLSPPCSGDPWGNTYQINTKWSSMIFDVAPPQWIPHCYDVFCVSPGKNGIIETPFGPAVHPSPGGTFRGGDDWVTVMAPCDP